MGIKITIMIWIVLLIGVVIVLSSSKSDVQVKTPISDNLAANPIIYQTASATNVGTKVDSNVVTTPLVPVVITHIPPSGYAGPVNGPFYWAGIGDPPNGVSITIGIAVDESGNPLNVTPISAPAPSLEQVPVSLIDPMIQARNGLRPAGYGYDASQNAYIWISYGAPYNNLYVIPL